MGTCCTRILDTEGMHMWMPLRRKKPRSRYGSFERKNKQREVRYYEETDMGSLVVQHIASERLPRRRGRTAVEASRVSVERSPSSFVTFRPLVSLK